MDINSSIEKKCYNWNDSYDDYDGNPRQRFFEET